MKYNGVIQRKLALLDDQIVELREHLQKKSYKDFEGSWLLRSMTERALQVAVEIIIDVAERIIALENAGPVGSAADAIKKLVHLKVLKSEKPFEGMVKFRNVIVHQYERVDPAILYNLATKKLGDFRKFIEAIDKGPKSEQ